jgi:hypothetical protein
MTFPGPTFAPGLQVSFPADKPQPANLTSEDHPGSNSCKCNDGSDSDKLALIQQLLDYRQLALEHFQQIDADTFDEIATFSNHISLNKIYSILRGQKPPIEVDLPRRVYFPVNGQLYLCEDMVVRRFSRITEDGWYRFTDGEEFSSMAMFLPVQGIEPAPF